MNYRKSMVAPPNIQVQLVVLGHYYATCSYGEEWCGPAYAYQDWRGNAVWKRVSARTCVGY